MQVATDSTYKCTRKYRPRDLSHRDIDCTTKPSPLTSNLALEAMDDHSSILSKIVLATPCGKGQQSSVPHDSCLPVFLSLPVCRLANNSAHGASNAETIPWKAMQEHTTTSNGEQSGRRNNSWPPRTPAARVRLELVQFGTHATSGFAEKARKKFSDVFMRISFLRRMCSWILILFCVYLFAFLFTPCAGN